MCTHIIDTYIHTVKQDYWRAYPGSKNFSVFNCVEEEIRDRKLI